MISEMIFLYSHLKTEYMKNDYFEFLSSLKKELPNVEIIEFRTRSLETMNGIMLTLNELGLFQVLWKIFELWINKHTNASIKISYQSTEGKLIEITYNKLNKNEAEEILSQNPPSLNRPTKIILP
jgi:hypothetical protein